MSCDPASGCPFWTLSPRQSRVYPAYVPHKSAPARGLLEFAVAHFIPASSSPPSSSQNLSALSQSSAHAQTKRGKIANGNEGGSDIGDESKKEKARQTWNSVFLNANDIPKPKCVAHGEPAKEYTVNKQGANKGKKFWICARPVGPGYDKGRAERLREEVDLQYRCNFFKWSSDWWRQVKKLSEEEKNGKV